MRKLWLLPVSALLAGGLALFLWLGVGRIRAAPPGRNEMALPLMFIENVGQTAPDVRFQVLGDHHTVWLAEQALWIGLTSRPQGHEPAADRDLALLRLSFPGANPQPRMEGFDRLETRVSYFLGRDPAGWRTDAPAWRGVRYRDIYPGVDLEITGRDGRWSWRFSAPPGPQVRLRVEGADAAQVEGSTLRLATAAGELAIPLLTGGSSARARPAVTQTEAGAFLVTAPFAAGPDLLASGDGVPRPAQEPGELWAFAYATFLGGHFYDGAYGLAVDETGAAYLAGSTASPDFPTTPGVPGPFYHGGDRDAFVVKLNPAGDALVYATFLGGVRDDRAYDVAYSLAVDGAGNAYVGGWTTSASFPVTPGAYDVTHNGEDDMFVVKLDPSGTKLLYATLLGGRKSEHASYLAVDEAGRAYITGWTGSTDFPTASADPAFQSFHGGASDVVVARLDPAGAGLDGAMLLGGVKDDFPYDATAAGGGVVCLTGMTNSPDFPLAAAFDASLSGDYDAFAACVEPAPGRPIFSTYLGGRQDDEGRGIGVDEQGNVHLTGRTNSPDFPVTAGAADDSYGEGIDAFVATFDAGGRLIYGSYFGASGNQGGYDLAVAPKSGGAVYIVGELDGALALKLDADGGAFHTLMTQPGLGRGWRVAADPSNRVYVLTNSDRDLPTLPDSFDPDPNGSGDAWLARLTPAVQVRGAAQDAFGQPLAGISVTANNVYTATTDAAGRYTLTLPAHVYVLRPTAAGYFWQPASQQVQANRPVVQVQDFVGSHVRKEGAPAAFLPVRPGDRLTYTVAVVHPEAGARLIYDPIPISTSYVTDSLAGTWWDWQKQVRYDPALQAITGTVTLQAGQVETLTFAVQVELGGGTSSLVNRACVHPPGSGLSGCEWSSRVDHYREVWALFLALVYGR